MRESSRTAEFIFPGAVVQDKFEMLALPTYAVRIEAAIDDHCEACLRKALRMLILKEIP
jgi:hypothetical protein